jgi:hypothetical protein
MHLEISARISVRSQETFPLLQNTAVFITPFI